MLLLGLLAGLLGVCGAQVAEVFVFHSNNYNEAAGDYKLWDWSKVTTVAVWKDRLLEEPDIVPFARARGAIHDALVNASDGVMGGVAPPDGAAWEPWFESGDPFAKYDDGEATGTAHLLRHGVDIGEAMKLGPLKWRRSGSPADLGSAAVALAWADAYLGEPDGMFMADEE